MRVGYQSQVRLLLQVLPSVSNVEAFAMKGGKSKKTTGYRFDYCKKSRVLEYNSI